MENPEQSSNMRVSRLQPPTQIPKQLALSDSDGNARSRMPPPAPVTGKRPRYNDPEPERVSLVERAGQCKPAVTATPGPRPVIKGTSLANTAKPGHGRNQSITSSISTSRTPSASSRSTSNSSFASTISHGRTTSSYGRPQTAFSKSTATRPNSGLPKPRPTTSHDSYSDDEDETSQRKRQGMLPSGDSPSPTVPPAKAIQNFRLRRRQSISPLKTSRSRASIRNVSITTAMSKLSIDGEAKSSSSLESQRAALRAKRSIPTLSHKSSIITDLRNQRSRTPDNAVVLYEGAGEVPPQTPSFIPVPSKLDAFIVTPTPQRNPKPLSPTKAPFLAKDSNLTSFVAFDVERRLEDVENMFSSFKNTITNVPTERFDEKESLYKTRILELEGEKLQLTSSKQMIQHELDNMSQKNLTLQEKMLAATSNFDEQLRSSRNELDDMRRDHRNDIDKARRDHTDEVDRLARTHREDLRELERRLNSDFEDRVREITRRNDSQLEEERSRRLREVQDLEDRLANEGQNLDLALQKKEREIETMRGELENLRGELDREQTLKSKVQQDLIAAKESLEKAGSESSSTIHTLEATNTSLLARIHFLESDSMAQSNSFTDMENRLQQALTSAEDSKKKLIKEETLRRLLFNQVQELKGNIRVMCRVRPVFDVADGDSAKLKYPDTDKESKELEILGKEEKSSLGKITRQTHAFTFDRVFGPESQNQEVFEEISQLVQSALDGYNVCIFCYGQTGSGKTHTMSSEDGMIPRATHQIYETATSLREKGWTYIIEGSFIEVYNEEIHDLLGNPKDFDKKKHEIKHDDQRKQTTVTGLKTVPLDSPDTVDMILKQAQNNRSVAATKSNERSSRSHSVFVLKLVGHNSTTNETSVGTLNLVDLAGSERLKSSGAEGDRMKETQNINKSLSCLGDVIGALGQGKEGAHIPYRNSKLTYLLQYSLGGNSKTLMFVMASPLQAHLSETITSLKFATKVHNTHIGTAKKSTKVKDRITEV